MMIRGEWSQLMAPGLHGVFLHWVQLKQRDEEYTKIFNVTPSDKAYEDDFEAPGLGPMPEKPEGENVQYQDTQEGGSKRTTNFTYALGVRASWELYEDDQIGVIKQIPKALTRSAHFAKEMASFNLLNLGFTTTMVADGLPLFSTAHTLAGGAIATNLAPGIANYISAPGTYPNRPVGLDLDLSFTALQYAINLYERMPDSMGMPIQLKPKTLVIPPEQKWIAREILGSAYKPFTADNEINSLLNEDLTYFVAHYLTSQTAWFLLPGKEDHTLRFINRKSFSDDYADDFDSFSIKVVARQRFGTGATTWWGVFGSNGP
jgi:phage major head subunit gpT-like protein